MRPRINTLTADQVRALLNYDPQTGDITWRVTRGRGVRVGDLAGTLNKQNGCRYVMIDDTRHLAHRLAWLMHHGDWPQENVSAKNGNYQDLRIENLQLKSASQTAHGRSATATGVTQSRHGTWRVEITRDYKRFYLGSYSTKEEAISIYKRAAESDDPSTLRPKGTTYKSYKVKLSRRKYHLLNTSWERVLRENGDVVGWDSLSEFISDVEDKIFPYSRVVAVDPDAPVGPENFKVERLSKFDRSTPEGRTAYYKHKNRVRKEIIKNHSLNKSFGISIDDYKRMLDAQGGVCALCGGTETHSYKGEVRSLSVDHCHATGGVRKLLCHACNHGLGCFKDDPDLMRAAALYIEHHRTNGSSAPASNIVHLKQKER